MTLPDESTDQPSETGGSASAGESTGSPSKRPWVPPHIEELPKLNDLTLQTTAGESIGGSEGVFP